MKSAGRRHPVIGPTRARTELGWVAKEGPSPRKRHFAEGLVARKPPASGTAGYGRAFSSRESRPRRTLRAVRAPPQRSTASGQATAELFLPVALESGSGIRGVVWRDCLARRAAVPTCSLGLLQ